MPRFITDADQGTLRKAFGRFPSGVTAVCAMDGNEPQGMAVSTFTSVSLEPPLASVCISRNSATWQHLRQSEHIGISVLGARHDAVCRQLSQKAGDRFSGIAWHHDDRGAVYIDKAAAWLRCGIEQEVPAGDHLIVLLRIEALAFEPETEPLVFHDSTFWRLAV